MDLWNNEVGRKIGDAVWRKEALARQVYQALKCGNLIIDLGDQRLTKLYPKDPKLQLPPGSPESEGVTKEDVEKINRDIQRQLQGGSSDCIKTPKNWIKNLSNWFDSYPDFSEAEQYASPIIFDLDGDGVKTLALAATRHFDLDNSGFAEQTAWVSSGDGLLVRDLDGNGRIERGAELFGNHTALGDGTNAADGYAALAQYDDNGDGLIDAEDAIWQQLQVWQDSDSNAQSAAEELHALADFDITAISLAATEVDETDTAAISMRKNGWPANIRWKTPC